MDKIKCMFGKHKWSRTAKYSANISRIIGMRKVCVYCLKSSNEFFGEASYD